MLGRLQEDFRAWLVSGEDQAAAPFGAGAEAGLAVYLNNYRTQLLNCLKISFPVVRSRMGEDAFRETAIAHIDRRPPRSWTLDAYAEDFPATLTMLHPDNPDLHELIWIEQSLADAFVGPDAEPLALEALGAADWETVRLVFAPTLVSRPATTNAAAVWTALRQDESPPEAEMLSEPAGLIVWRRGLDAFIEQIDAAEYQALQAIVRHGSFTALCAAMVEREGEEKGVALAATLLSGWLRRGLVVGLSE